MNPELEAMLPQLEWINVEDRLPTSFDEDCHGRVWVVAVDAVGRPYPSEATAKHVRDGAGQTFIYWMRPEFGIEHKRNRRDDFVVVGNALRSKSRET